MTLQLKLFGNLQIIENDTPLIQNLRLRAQRLSVYLLLNRQTILNRETVAFVLWPDNTEKEALPPPPSCRCAPSHLV